MYKKLKQQAFEANMQLPAYNLVIFTWGNVSAIDRDLGAVAIKPSGVEYKDLTAEDMVVIDLDGAVLEGKYRPSSDTPTHLELYRNFKNIGGVVHTHSKWATIFAQAKREIPAFGTTHADFFYSAVPCTRELTTAEIQNDYELNAGKVIVETYNDITCIDYNTTKAALISSHGPFTWGKDGFDAVHNAVVLEQIAQMAYYTQSSGNNQPINQELLDKHYLRKHGENAYYGQN